MALFRKNIWIIFYILTLLATLLLGIISYLKWQNTYLKYQSSQETIVELVSNATQSLFKTQEQLIDILGLAILEHNHHLHHNNNEIRKHAQPIIDNPFVIGLGITTPEGDFLFSSTHDDPTQQTSLLKLPQSKNSFLEALASHDMVFGRTYFSELLQKWGMPIRKAIRDQDGNTAFVITLLLKINGVFDHFLESIHHRQNLMVSIIRESDNYQQFNSKGKIEPEKYYLEPFPKQVMENVYTTIFDNFGITPQELKRDEPLVSFSYQHTDTKKYLASLRYNKTYKLWIVVHTQFETIYKDFLQTFFLYCAVYLGSGVLFFFLFKLIAKAEEKRRNDLLFQATHDQLTNLSNRNALQNEIHQWIYKNAPCFSLLYVDMDHFKSINDSFGHEYGDAVLVEISKRLKQLMPKNAIVVRYGGDEFVLLLKTHERKEVLDFAYILTDMLSRPYTIQNFNFNLGASIGIALYPEHGQNLNMLLRAADIALYESKKIKNSIHFFADAMQEGFLKNIQMEQELRKALEKNELYMMYQPQVDDKGHIYGVEALVRWESPLLGYVAPNHFIPIAETSGLMPKIGRFIVETSCWQMQDIQEKTGHSFQVSINISVRQFMDPTFLEHLVATIEKTKIQQLRITLEVTENLFIEDMEYILPLLEQIKTMGIHISMDDFGTGYSSLSMLRKLPIDELKIDKSFVDEIFEDQASEKMVQNIIAIGKNFGMHVLAEGVETKEQQDILISFGCDRLQGYYFSKPLKADVLLTFLTDKPFST